MRLLLTTALVTCLPVLTIAAEDEHKELDAHEHGAGVFNVAIEGKFLAMELEAPGADIVGFEHPAHSDKDKAAIRDAKSTLRDLAKIVALPAAADCKLTATNVALHTEGEDEDHDGHDHDHEKHAEEEPGHTEFHAEYQLNCANPENLKTLSFTYFETFKNAQKLSVSIVSSSSQKKAEATHDNAAISLGGSS